MSAAGRLREVTRPDGKKVSFEYDAFGRRVKKTFDGKVTEFVWDGNDLVHERTTDVTSGEKAPLVTWLFEPGMFSPVAKIEGRKRFGVVSDHLGVPTALMTEAGKIAWQAQLDVYGVVKEETPSGGAAAGEKERTGNPWRYPGQYEDAETGLYYNRFRYYDPEIGRYVSEDPIGLAGGVGLFGYVADSATWLDPFGLIGESSPVPESYMTPGNEVDMSSTPPGQIASYTKGGAPRSQDYFWNELLERRPEMFSKGNRWKVENGIAPRVDPTWIKHNPTHAKFKGDKLHHHHINYGNVAVPVPQTVHEKWSSRLHC